MAKGIAYKARDDVFSPTPSVETVTMMISSLASRGRRCPGQFRLVGIDVKRAFFYAPINRDVWVELLEEQRRPGQKCGKLRKGALRHSRCAPVLAEGS